MDSKYQRFLLIEKMYETALRMKLSHLAKKYDSNLVFELWTQLAKNDGVMAHFSNWRWKADMTITEALDCLDDFGLRLEALLRVRKIMRFNKESSLPI